MKNVQVIDGAQNCTYDIFALTIVEFEAMFPKGRDIEFIGDFIKRLGKLKSQTILDSMWQRRVDKKLALGIHGTLFYELELKKRFYPTKREADMLTALGAKARVSVPLL